MIITRAPLRISFSGGGTDIPAVYRIIGGGAVVSTAITRYVYVTLNEKFDRQVSVRYRIHEQVDRVRGIKHPLIRETLADYGIDDNVELVVASDVPARGSGLGASSALAVALSLACHRWTGRDDPDPRTLAERAAMIEIERVGSPIGKQDHYAAAWGGVHLFRFAAEGVAVEPAPPSSFPAALADESLLFYLQAEHAYAGSTFVQRILRDQVDQAAQQVATHRLQRDNALAMWEEWAYESRERFADRVNENWRLKQTLHVDITSVAIEAVILRARAAGAIAAKVCGAGGGGFLYVLAPRDAHGAVRQAVALPELRCTFTTAGAEVVFDDGARRHVGIANRV